MIGRHQLLDGGAAPRFAYATDLAGGTLDYHDANDLPILPVVIPAAP